MVVLFEHISDDPTTNAVQATTRLRIFFYRACEDDETSIGFGILSISAYGQGGAS